MPPVPSNFDLQSKHSDSLLIGWSKPSPPNGILTGYTLRYQVTDHSQYVTVNLSTSTKEFNITNLQPYTSYSVQVWKRVNLLFIAAQFMHRKATKPMLSFSNCVPIRCVSSALTLNFVKLIYDSLLCFRLCQPQMFGSRFYIDACLSCCLCNAVHQFTACLLWCYYDHVGAK